MCNIYFLFEKQTFKGLLKVIKTVSISVLFVYLIIFILQSHYFTLGNIFFGSNGLKDLYVEDDLSYFFSDFNIFSIINKDKNVNILQTQLITNHLYILKIIFL